MKAHFFQSDALRETGITFAYDRDISIGDSAQITYCSIRSADGGILALFDTELETWQIDGKHYSDVVFYND